MVTQISQEIRQQLTQLGEQVSYLERDIEAIGDMDQLCHVETIRESFDNTRALAKQITGIGQDIITDLKALKLRIKVLEAQKESLSLEDTFPEPASPLQDRTQGPLDTNDSFHIKIFNLYRTREDMLINLVSQGVNLHQAADQIESAFRGRISDLSKEATTPEESQQVNEFLIRNEQLHCRYFEEQVPRIMESLTDNNAENFLTVLSLATPLNDFVSRREFALEENKERMKNELDNLLFTLDTLITLQQVAENDAEGAQESIAGTMQLELDTLRMSLTENKEPAVDKAVEDDLEFAAALELSEQQPAEPEQDALTQAMSLLGGIGDSLVANQDPRIMIREFVITLQKEILDRKIMMTELLIPLQNANTAGDLMGAQDAIETIETVDAETMEMIFLLQLSLHRQLNKNNHGEYDADYGRMAFLDNLPIHMEKATQAERTTVINRALAKNLLSGIQAAILCNDNETLRNQLDQLKAIRFTLPGYEGEIDLESVISANLKRLHTEAGFAAEDNVDFGRLALRNEQGFFVPEELKVAAINEVEETLRELWEV